MKKYYKIAFDIITKKLQEKSLVLNRDYKLYLAYNDYVILELKKGKQINESTIDNIGHEVCENTNYRIMFDVLNTERMSKVGKRTTLQNIDDVSFNQMQQSIMSSGGNINLNKNIMKFNRNKQDSNISSQLRNKIEETRNDSSISEDIRASRIANFESQLDSSQYDLLECGGNVWTDEQTAKVEEIDKEYYEELEKKEIDPYSKDASDFWKANYKKIFSDVFKNKKRYVAKSSNNYIWDIDGEEKEYSGSYFGIFDTKTGYFTNLSTDKVKKPYLLDHKVAEEIAELQNSGDIKESDIYTVPHLRHKFDRRLEEGGKIATSYPVSSTNKLWTKWDIDQRRHFLNDHVSSELESNMKDGDTYESVINMMPYNKYEDLPTFVKDALQEHFSDVRYAKGGKIKGMKEKYDNIIHDKLPESIRKEFAHIKDKTKDFTVDVEHWGGNLDRLYILTKKHVKEAFKDYVEKPIEKVIVKPVEKVVEKVVKPTKEVLKTKITGLKILEKRLKGDAKKTITSKIKGLEVLYRRIK